MTHVNPANTGQFDDDEDDDLSDEELEYFRGLLLAERAKVRARLDRHVKESVFELDSLPDEIDQASRESEQTAMLRLADKERKLLAQIERALAKFDSGDYGVCEGTGDPIGRKRLKARPWTRHSIHFKELLERQKKG